MFEEKAGRFVDEELDGMKVFDEGDFVSSLHSEIYPFRERERISLLESIKTDIDVRKTEHNKTCQDPARCQATKKYDKAIVFVNQELTDLGALIDGPTEFPHGSTSSNSGSSTNGSTSFSKSELENIHAKFDEVLYQLQLHGLADEIIFNEIAELKRDSSRVTKKDLGLMVVGTIVQYGTAEIAKMPAVQQLYDLIKVTVKGLPAFKL